MMLSIYFVVLFYALYSTGSLLVRVAYHNKIDWYDIALWAVSVDFVVFYLLYHTVLL